MRILFLIQMIVLLMHSNLMLNAADQHCPLALQHDEQAFLAQCKKGAPRGYSFIALAKTVKEFYFAIYRSDMTFGPHIKMGHINQLKDQQKRVVYHKWTGRLFVCPQDSASEGCASSYTCSAEVHLPKEDNPEVKVIKHIYYEKTKDGIESAALTDHSLKEMEERGDFSATKRNLLEIIK